MSSTARPPIEGVRYLVSDLRVACEGDTYTVLTISAAAVLLVVGIGFPTGYSSCAVHRRSSKIGESSLSRNVGLPFRRIQARNHNNSYSRKTLQVVSTPVWLVSLVGKRGVTAKGRDRVARSTSGCAHAAGDITRNIDRL
jgi:hypothetical protein